MLSTFKKVLGKLLKLNMKINGATIKDESKESLVIKLAKKYMKNYYKNWDENALNKESLLA